MVTTDDVDSPFLSAFGLDSSGVKATSGASSASSSVSPEIAGYLSQLSSFGLERLTREPERLAEEKTAILEQTKELASQNYKTFIETAECSKEIFEDFVDVENRLGNLLEQKLPLCSSSCKDFQTQAEEISQKRRLNNQILQKHSQLLEILEVPQLIDTCVKNGHFDEALELANYIRRLEKKHGSQIPLVRSILFEVRNCIQSMVGQLISQLRTAQLTLPVCLKVIGHIRRLDVFSETELRVLFLNARDSWLQSTLASIPKDDAYTHVIKTVDATRVHLFDIVTQYKAIFTDETDVRSASKRASQGVPSFQTNDSSILYSWILEKAEAFLRTLTTDLVSPSVEQRLDAVFNQCMYFGLSFGRVGIDLRPLLIPIFEETSMRFLKSGLDRGLKTFEEELKLLSFTSSPVCASSGNSVLAMSLDLSASLSGDLDGANSSMSSSSGLFSSTNQPPPPPLSLLEFPPLASLYNDILNLLNDFRSTATLDALFPTKSALSSHLRGAGQIAVSVFDSLKNSFTETEAENFQRLCMLFVETLVPNVVKCFKCLFPSQQVAEALGIGIGQVHKSNVFSFDMEAIRSVFPPESFPNLVLREGAVVVGDSDIADATEKEESGAAGNGTRHELNAEEAVKSIDLEPAGAVEIGKLDTAEAVESAVCNVKDDDVVQEEDVNIASSKPDSATSAAKDSLDALNDHLEAVSLTEKIASSEDTAAHSSSVKSLDSIVKISTALVGVEDDILGNPAEEEIVEKEEKKEEDSVAIVTSAVAADLNMLVLTKPSETGCASSKVEPSIDVDNLADGVKIISGPSASDLDVDPKEVSSVTSNSELASPEAIVTGEVGLDEVNVSVEVTEMDPVSDKLGTETARSIEDGSQCLPVEDGVSGASASIVEAPQPQAPVNPSEENDATSSLKVPITENSEILKEFDTSPSL